MFKVFRNKIKSIEVIRYAVVGALTTCIGYAVYYILLSTILDAKQPIELQLANIISWIIGMVFSFYASRRYVFYDNSKNKIIKAMKFCSSRIIVMLIECIQLFFYVNVLGLDARIMKVFAMGVTVILNFCISKYIIFTKNDAK